MIKYTWIGFLVSCGLGSHDEFKKIGDARRAHFFRLGLVKSIGNYVEAIGFFEVTQNFF